MKEQQVRIERISQTALTFCGRAQKDRSCDPSSSSLFPHVWLHLQQTNLLKGNHVFKLPYKFRRSSLQALRLQFTQYVIF